VARTLQTQCYILYLSKNSQSMAFRFSMQKVLEYREQQEEEAKVRMASAQRRLLDARSQEAAVQSEMTQALDRLNQINMVQQGERWLQEQYIKGLQSDLAAAALQTRMAEQVADEARALLAARAMDRKLLEKLKEHKKKHYQREESLKEQRFNDEIATLRYKAPSF